MGLSFDRRFAYEKWARVHFIPDLKVGVFVTLRAPNVIKTNLYIAIIIANNQEKYPYDVALA